MKSLERIEKYLRPFIKEELLEEIMGDLYEYYDEILEKNFIMRWVLLWFHASQFLRPSLVKSITGQTQLNNIGMFKLNFKIAVRQFKKQRIISINSALLLIISTLSFQMIFAWLDNEWKRDQFHEKLDRLYLSTVKTNPTANLTSISLSTMFQLDYSQFPEIEQTAQVHIYGSSDAKLSTDEYDHWGKAIVADSNFLDLFDFEVLAGNEKNVLFNPTNIVITASFAERMFGSDDPIGETVYLSCDQKGTYQIGAVLDELPSTSSMQFDMLIPRHSQPFWRRIPQEIVLASTPLDLAFFNDKIKMLGRTTNTRFPDSELSLVSFSDLYLSQPVSTSLLDSYGSKEDLINLALMAAILLIIGWLGFNHLQSTTLLSQHQKLGIQQVMGSSKGQLWNEILMARLLLGIVSILITFLIYRMVFANYTSAFDLPLDARPLHDVLMISVVIGAVVTSSLIVARWQLYRIGIDQVFTLKSNLFRIPTWQRGFSVLQIGLSMSLLIISAIVFQQFRYLQNQKIGYHHEDIVAIDYFEMLGRYVDEATQAEAQKNFNYLRDQLANHSSVHSFSQGDLPLSPSINATSWKKVGELSEYTTENMMVADPNYQNLLSLELIEGRFFSDSLDQPNQQKVVINEAAKKYWNIEDIENTRLQSNTSGRQEFQFEIIGVVKDYHYEHLSQEIKPLVMRYRPYQDDQFLIRFQQGQLKAGLSHAESLFKEINPKGIYSYLSLNDQILNQYKQEERLGKIAFGFALGALLLSSLCLFTIAVHESQRRTKEIGIRKVLGASTESIFGLQSRSFLYMIGIAFLLALPITYFFQNQWLADYASRINVEIWVYLLGGLLTGFLALIATSWQSWRTATRNPVDSLRSE